MRADTSVPESSTRLRHRFLQLYFIIGSVQLLHVIPSHGENTGVDLIAEAMTVVL